MSCYDEDYGEPELKGVDASLRVDIGGITTGTTGPSGGLLINNVYRGDQPYQRIGDHIELKSLYVRLTPICRYAPAADGGGMLANIMRAVVVFDRYPNAPEDNLLPEYYEVFFRTFTNGTGNSGPCAGLAYGTERRFEILGEKTFISSPKMYYPPGDLSRASEEAFDWEEEYCLDGLSTDFTDVNTSTTIEDIQNGAIYLYVKALVNTSGLSQWYLPPTSWARLRYTDA